MKWLTALVFGALLGGVLPTVIDGQAGVWADSWAGWGTYRPNGGGFLFSIPLANMKEDDAAVIGALRAAAGE